MYVNKWINNLHVCDFCDYTGSLISLIYLADVKFNKQSVPVNGLCVSWLCVLSFRAEEKDEKDTKDTPCKWYSEVKYQVNC